jgi:hypothetical protein
MGVRMDNVKKAFQKYAYAAADLADSVKRNIVKDGVIDDKTVNCLNDLIIATNELAEVQDEMLELNDENETNKKLN